MKRRKTSYQSNKIKVMESPGKGRGVFAVRDIEKDELIEIAPVLFIPAGEQPILDASILGFYVFSPNDRDDGASVLALGYVSLYNNTKRPNAYYSVSSWIATIQADRKIKAGTEITVDYGWDKFNWKQAKSAVPGAQ